MKYYFEYLEGKEAYGKGKVLSDNPYYGDFGDEGEDRFEAWYEGFMAAMSEDDFN